MPGEGPLPSAHWKAHFRRGQANPSSIPWETASSLTPLETDTIRASIQEFQLGEQAEGRHLIRSAHEHAAMQPLIREEQGHAALLQRLLFAGACVAVWRRHRSVLRAGGLSLRSFRRLSHEELRSGLSVMEGLSPS